MSKIGTNNIVGKPFIPIVTTLSFDELRELKENNKSIEITNGIIFSIPQEGGEDKEYEGSIWLTDNDGLLYPLTLTIKQQSSNNNNENTKTIYYWYVGVISPTDPNNALENTGNNKWTRITSTPESISVNTSMEIPPSVWYIAIPHSYDFQAYDSTGAAPDIAAYTKSSIIISGIQYDLFTGAGKALAVNGVFKK